MEERGWEYRRRQPQGTVLYEAVRDHLATLLAETGELGRGLPRYAVKEAGLLSDVLTLFLRAMFAPSSLATSGILRPLDA